MSGTTKREQILDALKTVLESVTTPTALSGRVERSLKVGTDRQEAPVVIVEPINDTPQNESIYRLNWRLLVRISLIVRGAVPDRVADPIIESIHEAIMADISLGGLSMDVEPGQVNFDLVNADGSGGIIPIDYVVVYQTSRESMSTI